MRKSSIFEQDNMKLSIMAESALFIFFYNIYLYNLWNLY